ncbi:MAG: sensor histidine kinase [Candidatus Nitrospinota bacterium M3_3B_026]
MPATSPAADLKKFRALVRKKQDDDSWFWRLQVAARDAIMSVDVSSTADPAGALAMMLDIFQDLLGGSSASIVIKGEDGWRVEEATGEGAGEITGKTVDPDDGSISSAVIRNSKPYYFSNIDDLKEIKRQNHPTRHSENIFCSFPLLSFDGNVMGILNVGGMREAHPFFAVDKSSIGGALKAVAAKIAKLRKNAQVKMLESSVREGREKIETIEKDLAQLREAETIKERLLYMTIHDLKNPLSLVISNLAYLEGTEPGGETTDILKLSRFGCERLLDMIKATLDSHKMEIGKFQLHTSCFNLTDMARRILKEFEVVARFDEIRMEYNGPDRAMVEADGGVVRRILSNLLDNALRHSPTGGRVTVGVREEGEMVLLSVSDEGEGVDEADRERIFNAFEQAKSSMKPGGGDGSHGLGLAFCKLAAEAHGGSISLDSEQGKGARFTVSLPAMEEENG